MNIPSPVAVKKLIDEKRASEPTQPEKVSSRFTKSTRTGTTSSEDGPKVRESISTTSKKNSSTKRTNSGRSKEVSETMGNEHQNFSTKRIKSDEKSKKPFVRPEHLTQKPLRNNQDLEALKKSLERSSTRKSAGNNRAPHKVPRTGGTSRVKGRNSNKENN